MRYALIEGGQAREIFPGQPFTTQLLVEVPAPEPAEGEEPGEAIQELQEFTFISQWFDAFGPDDFERYGIVDVVPAASAPEGQRVASTVLEVDGGEVIEVATYEALPPVPLDDLKAAKLADLLALYQAKYDLGFAYEFEGVTETLQMRPQDLVNWLAFKDTCNDGIAAGFGAAPCPQNIRVTSNAEYTVSFAEGAAVMTALKAYGGGLLARQWALKDQIRSAPSAEALADIDILAGWPA